MEEALITKLLALGWTQDRYCESNLLLNRTAPNPESTASIQPLSAETGNSAHSDSIVARNFDQFSDSSAAAMLDHWEVVNF